MVKNQHTHLSRRERQILDILFRRGKATAAEILADLPDPPGYSAVRAHLRTMEQKGQVSHRAEDLRYVYMPAVRPEKAMRGALRHLVETFFGGSPTQAMVALLDTHSAQLSGQDLQKLSRMIENARKDGR
ncbi:MAG: BlaI/MecI/CopY family transcriptional regulator [Acidobacteriia bacterium]|nr:BlaI/MecI/CopY family transcriptional regulator [Terriglobia bacterium]